ncbi:uncharacterized protein LOC117490950 [Trematomus bernacchii]|uniref:uncharacterized protein LOC117490950 n=1 Tax=Trematomus bernacchii TaxID=40690 RepID=UPI00146F13FC|nr:uncharacterized protein LOC117490950 [Trematomus bernacchii]
MRTVQRQLRERWSLCTPTVATSSTSLTRRAKGCLAVSWLRTSPSLSSTQGSSSGWSSCTGRQAKCLRTSAWTPTFRTRLLPSSRWRRWTRVSRKTWRTRPSSSQIPRPSSSQIPPPPAQQPGRVIRLTHPGVSLSWLPLLLPPLLLLLFDYCSRLALSRLPLLLSLLLFVCPGQRPTGRGRRRRLMLQGVGRRPGAKPASRQVNTPAASVARPRGSTLATLALQVCLTARLPVGELWSNGGWR